MVTATIDHIVIDEKGKAKIRNSRIKVTHLVGIKAANNMTIEELCLEYPHIARSAIYAAFAYYYDNQEELDRQMAESEQRAQELWEAQQNDPVMKKLRAVKASGKGNEK